MERAIIKSEDGKQYFFYDNPEWEVDYKKSEVEGVLDIKVADKISAYDEADMGMFHEKIGLFVDLHFFLCSSGAGSQASPLRGLCKHSPLQLHSPLRCQHWHSGQWQPCRNFLLS